MAKQQPTQSTSKPSKGTTRLCTWLDRQPRGARSSLAGTLGVSNGTVSHLLAGRSPSLPQAIALHELIGIPYKWWVEPA